MRTPRGRELLTRFQELVAEIHPRLRAQDTVGTIDTSVGEYPVRRQTWYLANELAIYARRRWSAGRGK